MRLGFVGLGKMGANMVHRLRRDSGPAVVVFGLRPDAVAAGTLPGVSRPRDTARTRRSLTGTSTG